jgi:alkylation response protein AidB-like acyl-CoA dehydrogenase
MVFVIIIKIFYVQLMFIAQSSYKPIQPTHNATKEQRVVMDFAWNTEQLEYKSAAIRFAQKELSQGVTEREQAESFARDLWQKCADFGVLGLPFPEDYGGAAADILTTMLVMEGLGYGGKDNGLLFALNAQMWAVQHPISAFGTAEQKERWLPHLIRGRMPINEKFTTEKEHVIRNAA